ncbi:MAG: hypothetical protein WA728_17920 [Xanthobacteraceae bacterium]
MTAPDSIQWAPWPKHCAVCAKFFEGGCGKWTCSQACERRYRARWKRFTDEEVEAAVQLMSDEMAQRFQCAPVSELKADYAERGGCGAEDELRRRGYDDWIDRCERFRELQKPKWPGIIPTVTLAALAAWDDN